MDLTVDQMPDTLVVEHEGRQIPLRDHPFVKEAPDLSTLVKQGFDAHREVGARVRVPGKEAKAEEISAFKSKMYEAGLFAAPPSKLEDYGIAKPEKLPDGMAWNDELAGELGKVLLKHGAPKGLAADLLDLHQKSVLGAHTSLHTSFDAGIEALKKEHGDKFEERQALAGRFAATIFKTPEELAFFENTGLANHPGFLSILMRLAPLAQQDSSFLADIEKGSGGGGSTGDDVRSEVSKIMTDKANPMYEGYWRRDPKVMEHIDGIYRKVYGDAKVEIS